MFKKFPEDGTALLATDETLSDKRAVVCVQCRAYVTDPGAKQKIEGMHIHTGVNPAGITYTLSCYHYAPGCITVGAPTPDHSWFAGFCWCIALCGGCKSHIGWQFSGNSGGFFGLIVDRIAEQQME